MSKQLETVNVNVGVAASEAARAANHAESVAASLEPIASVLRAIVQTEECRELVMLEEAKGKGDAAHQNNLDPMKWIEAPPRPDAFGPAASATPSTAPAERTRSTRSAAPRSRMAPPAPAPRRAATAAGRARGGAAGRGGTAGRGRGRGAGRGAAASCEAKVAAPNLPSISNELSQQLLVSVQEKKSSKTIDLAASLQERKHDLWAERVTALNALPGALENQVSAARLPEALHMAACTLAVLMRGNQQMAADAHLQVLKATVTLALTLNPAPALALALTLTLTLTTCRCSRQRARPPARSSPTTRRSRSGCAPPSPECCCI